MAFSMNVRINIPTGKKNFKNAFVFFNKKSALPSDAAYTRKKQREEVTVLGVPDPKWPVQGASEGDNIRSRH